MKQSRKAYWSSWLLLSVFVPMVLLSSMHVHQPIASAHDDCEMCLEHQVHAHLDALTAHIDCFLCHFSNNFYQSGHQDVAAVEQHLSCVIEHPIACTLPQGKVTATMLRGPPQLILYQPV